MDALEWDQTIAGLPGAHILQSEEWGQLKAAGGWQPLPQVWRDDAGQVQAAALVLRRSIPASGFAARMHVLYIPRGPLLDWSDRDLCRRVLDDLQKLARKQGAIFLKMDPEVILGRGVPNTEDARDDALGQEVRQDLVQRGWGFSPDQIQFRNTVWIDLRGDEQQWLARMKQKARYNLRLAQKKGVQVRPADAADFPLLYHMYAETALRDGFVIRSQDYYFALWQKFFSRGLAYGLVAEVDGEAVGGLILFVFSQKAWYLYGMSRQMHREKMPSYLLQWEAMRLARSLGCTHYDLWGAPDEFIETDSMWGVFRFKEGLGGEVIRTLGAWDYTTKPWLYRLYTSILPKILNVMRRRGEEQTRRVIAQ